MARSFAKGLQVNSAIEVGVAAPADHQSIKDAATFASGEHLPIGHGTG